MRDARALMERRRPACRWEARRGPRYNAGMKRRIPTRPTVALDVSEPLARLDAAIARADPPTAAHLRMLRESLLAVGRGEGRQLTDAEFKQIYGPKIR